MFSLVGFADLRFGRSEWPSSCLLESCKPRSRTIKIPIHSNLPPMALQSLRNPSLLPSVLNFRINTSSKARLVSLNRVRFPVRIASLTTTAVKMSLDEWKTRAPYKVHENDPNFKVRYEAACHCGRVKYQLSREKPLDAKYCHCTTCQKLHGMPH